MKDITDYFSSPTKASKSADLVDKVIFARESPDQNVNTENKIDDASTNCNVSKAEPPKRIKKKRCKPTDPEAKNVTELLSNNLSLISPKASGTEKVNSSSPLKKKSKKGKRNSLGNSEHDNVAELKPTTSDTLEIEDREPNMEAPKNTSKVNAFQLLMNSRNNIIGQNCGGKIVSELESSTNDPKSNLDTRKELFRSWADQKGALKRQREEEEIEKCINHKLETRTKRLKKLLQGNTEVNDKISKKKETPVRTKKTAKVSPGPENSTYLSTNKVKEPRSCSPLKIDKLSEVMEEHAQDAIITISSSPAKKHHKENSQNNLLNFFGALSKEPKEERIEVFEDSSKEPSKELIKIKMFTPQSTKKRISLLSLNREQTKSITDESSQESVKVRRHKNKKRKHKETEEKSLSEVQLNDSLDDFCTPEKKTANASVKMPRKALQKEDQSKMKKYLQSSKNNLPMDGSTQEYNVIKPKRNKKHCFLASFLVDDSDNSHEDPADVTPKVNKKRHVETQSNDNSLQDIEISKNKDLKSKSEMEKALKYFSNEDNVVTDESTQEYDVLKPKRKRNKRPCVLADSDDSQPADVMPKINEKRNTKTEASENSMQNIKMSNSEDQIKPELMESEGRRLRPKRNNVNYSNSFKDKTPKSLKTNKEEKSSVKRSKKTPAKDESREEIQVSSDSEYEEAPKKKVSVKVAPVFLKATPKPKLDPEVVKARKKFLLSGVPDSLKKTVEKQRSIEEKEYDIFPSISHIQQKCGSRFWELPKPNLKYVTVASFNPSIQSPNFCDLIVKKTTYKVDITTEIDKICHVKSLLNKIKADNPNYPVYKVFRHIYEKSGKNFLKEQLTPKKSPKRRSKKGSRKSTLKNSEVWSEKYKARCAEEILGNHSGVSALKNWLETWMNYSEEINARGKRQRANSNSESDFETTDCDSRDSTRLPGNTMILEGPCGSGKTSAVYAIASELGFNVLELNASSKRTGKRLLQELQEATQSHQVRKNENAALTNFVNSDKIVKKDLKSKNPKNNEVDPNSEERNKKKMCILLIEDVDLVFDQDDGFLTSLTQLITTSKRPIILTTTDDTPAHVQKLLAQHECISFMPLPLQCLDVWLQILCLVEGLVVGKDDLGCLLQYNKGDIRKTLLQVQFWCQSGGQLEKSRIFPLQCQDNRDSVNIDLKVGDEDLKLDLIEGNRQDNCFVHKHCIGSFEVLRENKEHNVPGRFDIGMIWWNVPNILNVSSCAAERRQGVKSDIMSENVSELDSNKLNAVLGLYDALILTDSLFKSVNYQSSDEPVVKNWMSNVRDSTELTERMEDQGVYSDVVQDLTHTLVNGWIDIWGSIDGTKCRLNVALPDTHHRRWRTDLHNCEDFLKEPIPLLNTRDRSSIALDYLPTLRDMARYEDKRTTLNTKRGNRFRHYFKSLNMNFKERTCKLACNILNATDDD